MCLAILGKILTGEDRKELRSGRVQFGAIVRSIRLDFVPEAKPLKYPSIFFKSELLVLTKTDLLPYVPFDIVEAEDNARRVHPDIDILRVSNSSGDGLEQWLAWLMQRRHQIRLTHAASLV
jgi:hypothetical protein